MKNIAILDYLFMFDPTEGWSNGFYFERDLADFFAAHGFEARIVESTGGLSRRVVWLSKIEMPPPLPAPQRTVQKTLSDIAKTKLKG